MVESERERKIKESIRQRLAPVCGDMSEREFDELVEKVARNQLKSEYGRLHLTAEGWDNGSAPRSR